VAYQRGQRTIPSLKEEAVMPVRRTAVVGALLIGMLATALWWTPAASAQPGAAVRRAPAVVDQATAAAGVRAPLPAEVVFRERTTWYSLACVWSVCDTLFSLTALQHFSQYGYLTMLLFNVWHPQVRAAIAIYASYIDVLADQAMLQWPRYSIETVTSSEQWLGYSIGLYTVGA
jgi:hypothetical protein